MTIQQLKYAIRISEVGSLNKASEILYISQPSLTSAIKELEDELGFAIFNRTSKGVILTSEGEDFIQHAGIVYSQYESLNERFCSGIGPKKKFAVSCQHYSFAVKAFINMAKKFDSSEYEFAFRETKTLEVIEDVQNLKSEIGIIFLSDFNRKAIMKLLNSADLTFTSLKECKPCVYLWRGHPLAKQKSISFEQLKDYPKLSFDQGGNSSFYFAEEIFSEYKFPQIIKVNDRATVLNFMLGLGGYTLCSGIINGELNNSEYIAIPLQDETLQNDKMEIGCITKSGMQMSLTGEEYMKQLKSELEKY